MNSQLYDIPGTPGDLSVSGSSEEGDRKESSSVMDRVGVLQGRQTRTRTEFVHNKRQLRHGAK